MHIKDYHRGCFVYLVSYYTCN